MPILAATVLCENECTIHNCPDLTDVNVSIEILKYLGASVVRDGHTLYVNAREIYKDEIPDVLMREMRSSIVFGCDDIEAEKSKIIVSWRLRTGTKAYRYAFEGFAPDWSEREG